LETWDDRHAVSGEGYSYDVWRDVSRPGHTQVALVRRAPAAPHRLALRRAPRETPVILFARTFRPLVELNELERYAAQLELLARHANERTLGCFVDTRPHEGVVDIALYDRWFDGDQLRFEELSTKHLSCKLLAATWLRAASTPGWQAGAKREVVG
jgi:hypothetical protein